MRNFRTGNQYFGEYYLTVVFPHSTAADKIPCNAVETQRGYDLTYPALYAKADVQHAQELGRAIVRDSPKASAIITKQTTGERWQWNGEDWARAV